jgi:hypothetical protein
MRRFGRVLCGFADQVEIIRRNVPDDMVLAPDFVVIVGKSISFGITRRSDRHSNGGSPERLPRKCGPEKVTKAREFGCRLPFVFDTRCAV